MYTRQLIYIRNRCVQCCCGQIATASRRNLRSRCESISELFVLFPRDSSCHWRYPRDVPGREIDVISRPRENFSRGVLRDSGTKVPNFYCNTKRRRTKSRVRFVHCSQDTSPLHSRNCRASRQTTSKSAVSRTAPVSQDVELYYCPTACSWRAVKSSVSRTTSTSSDIVLFPNSKLTPCTMKLWLIFRRSDIDNW